MLQTVDGVLKDICLTQAVTYQFAVVALICGIAVVSFQAHQVIVNRVSLEVIEKKYRTGTFVIIYILAFLAAGIPITLQVRELPGMLFCSFVCLA